MDMNKVLETDCGSGGGQGREEQGGKSWDNCN